MKHSNEPKPTGYTERIAFGRVPSDESSGRVASPSSRYPFVGFNGQPKSGKSQVWPKGSLGTSYVFRSCASKLELLQNCFLYTNGFRSTQTELTGPNRAHRALARPRSPSLDPRRGDWPKETTRHWAGGFGFKAWKVSSRMGMIRLSLASRRVRAPAREPRAIQRDAGDGVRFTEPEKGTQRTGPEWNQARTGVKFTTERGRRQKCRQSHITLTQSR